MNATGGGRILGGAIRLHAPEGADRTIAQINDAYARLYSERRSEVIRLLRQMPSFVEVVRSLQQDTRYRVVMPPGGENLGRSSRVDGLFTANVHGVDGKFMGQAQLERLTPDFASSVNQLANQQAFAEMLQRLEAIDHKIGEVLAGQHLDRIARVDAGIRIYYQALVAEDESRPSLMSNAVTELQKALEMLLAELRRDIEHINQLPSSFFGAAFAYPAPHQQADEKIKPMQETYRAILRAAYFLPIAHESMGSFASQQLCLRQLQEITQEFKDDLPKVERWLESDEATALAANWTSGWKIASNATQAIRQLTSGLPEKVEIEFTPSELIGED